LSISFEENKVAAMNLNATINERIEIDEGAYNYSSDFNWYELRVRGKQPERRAYHSTFIY
jgi:hypothetical protein